MTRYRNQLPQLDGGLYLTDGGIETTLIFHDGLELPDFAAFHLLRNKNGQAALTRYFRTYAPLAVRYNCGLVLESATWRASADWGARLGYAPAALAESNRQAIRMLEEIREEMPAGQPVVISGCLGPRGDGYVPSQAMSADEAAAYHRAQVETFAGTAADMVSAITMNYAEEAIGIAVAANTAGKPVSISFTVETDVNLPTGEPLIEAIARVEEATGGYPAYFMLNCAHPDHFRGVLSAGEAWTRRIRGLRANASRKSHAELNESAELDIGDPPELGSLYAELRRKELPRLNVMGGCCGTDHRHVECIAAACVPLFC
jgi:homocysteine S-methyltransferase